MASTNKTTNYELSQYVGTDKPTYLGDYNGDMLKIDTAIHGVATSVGTETGRINVLENNVGTMSSLDTTDKTSLVNAINEVNTNSNNNATNIGTLSNLDTYNKSTLVNAINEVVNKFNFSYKSLTPTLESGSGYSFIGTPNLNSAYNSDGSIGKIYGTLTLDGSNVDANKKLYLSDTGLRPESDITINGLLIKMNRNDYQTYSQSYTLKTDGTVETVINSIQPGARFMFIAGLIFAKDFGDTPIPNA